MSDLTKYQTDHLILLVGSNPLPNYVAGKLLVKPTGQIYLVHSDQTQTQAKALKELLAQEKIAAGITLFAVKENEAANIYSQINHYLEKAAGSIGLNYTGGTKAMAVHAYRAVKGKDPLAVCSYLDARDYKMYFDPIGTNTPAPVKVLMEVDLTLENLLKLHEIELDKETSKKIWLPSSADPLAQLHATSAGGKAWRDWCNQELRAKCRKGNNWFDENKLRKIALTWADQEPAIKTVFATILGELGLPSATELDLVKVVPYFGKSKYFCEWLDGKWLEHYAFYQVTQVANSIPLASYDMNLDTIQSQNKPDFELDIGVMRGYQLFGISCTSDPFLTKSKLFEAYIRARQLGGDEARAAVVCPHDTPDKVRKEVEYDAPHKVRVFGAAHLADAAKFRQDLQEWFETAS